MEETKKEDEVKLAPGIQSTVNPDEKMTFNEWMEYLNKLYQQYAKNGKGI